MDKKVHIRDGEEVYGADEVKKIEAVSVEQLDRDLQRASTWIASKHFDRAEKILKPFEYILGR